MRRQLCRPTLAILFGLLLSTTLPAQTWNDWPSGSGSGDWSDNTKWSLMHRPTSSETVRIDGSGTPLTVTIATTDEACYELDRVDGNASVSMSGGSLSGALNEYIGRSSTGTFTQSGGNNTMASTIGGYLMLGQGIGSSGNYTLTGTGQLSAMDEHVGYSGTGTFTQTGGNNTLNGTLWLGNNTGSSGSYALSGTGQLSASYEEIGWLGTGRFTQTGGNNTIAGGLFLGDNTDSSGSYSLSGTGRLSAMYEGVGFWGTGNFTQSGGNNTIATNLWLGIRAGSSGNYTLSGTGQLSAALSEYVGRSGTGTFTQSGGTNTIGNNLYLGYDPGSSGNYTISAGKLSADSIYVGAAGSGMFSITGPEAEITVSGNLSFGADGTFAAVPGSTIHMTGAALVNQGTNPTSLSGLENLTLVFEGGLGIYDPFEVAGKDLGAVMEGFQDNFTLGTLQLGGNAAVGQVRLVDEFDNQPGWIGNEALYVKDFVLGSGSSLDLNGLNLYYLNFVDHGGTIILNGGRMSAVPEPGTVVMLAGLAAWLGYIGRRRWRARRR